MNHAKLSRAFQAFSESFALLAEALAEDVQDLPGAGADETPAVQEDPAPSQEEKPKAAKDPALKKTVSKKVWDEEPPAEKDPEVIELEDLQEAGRQVIKLHGAPALAQLLKAKGLKNLSSTDPEDYPTLYAELKELTDE